MFRMTAMQFLDKRCDCYHFTERDGVNPYHWLSWVTVFAWSVCLVSFKHSIFPPEPLEQSATAPSLGQQDRHDDRRNDQEHNIVEETPHMSCQQSAIS